MFTVRYAPNNTQDFLCNRRSTFPRQRYQQGLLNDFLYQDLADFMLYPLLGVMAQRSGRRNCDKPPGDHNETKWVKTLKLKGFTPDEVQITTNEGRVLINARSVKAEGENTDIHETNRVIPIPDSVDINSMRSRFTSDGLLTIEAMLTVDNETIKESFTEVPIKRELETSEQVPDDISLEDCMIQSVSSGSMEERPHVGEDHQPEKGIVEYPESIENQDRELTEHTGTSDDLSSGKEHEALLNFNHQTTKND